MAVGRVRARAHMMNDDTLDGEKKCAVKQGEVVDREKLRSLKVLFIFSMSNFSYYL